MDRWIKYKGQYINLGQARHIHVDRANEDMQSWNKKTGASKKKPYILFVDHNGIDAFENRKMGENVVEDILKGKYDCAK